MNQGDFSITILGSNSALPANNRNPSAQLLQCDGHHYLIDCGEGTQTQFRRYKLKMQRIKVVFISHLHGDHYYGLLGLMNTMHLLGRTAGLTIVAPAKLKEIIEIQLKAGGGFLKYPIKYIQTDEVFTSNVLLEVYRDQRIVVKAFPLKHRIPCAGFLFSQIERERSYLPEVGAKYQVPLKAISGIKKGQDFVLPNGSVIHNEELTSPPPMAKSYAYCTDTLPLDSTKKFVKSCDCLYHEATFMDLDEERSKSTFHSTGGMAARIAKDSDVKQLLIGHFSARYKDLKPLLIEAQSVFPNTQLALEGETFEI